MNSQVTVQNPFEDVSDGSFLLILEYLQENVSILEALEQDALSYLISLAYSAI